MLTPTNQTHARVLFWLSIAICAMAVSAILVAELFMPENFHGQKAVVLFYRVFGTCLVVELAIALYYQRRLLERDAA